MADLISLDTLQKEDLLFLLDSADGFEKNIYSSYESHKEKILATMFFENSTRTKLSFQAAAQRLGMSIIDYNHQSSSSKKGESFSDTIKMVDSYADAIAIRHHESGSAKKASEIAEHPIVNAGDGPNKHPTQALIDLYTIKKTKERLEDLKITIAGDLRFGRTVHSLLVGLNFFGADVTLVSPPELELEAQYLDDLNKLKITKSAILELEDTDVLYMTRLQEERLGHRHDPQKLRGSYGLTPELLKKAKEDLIILHPLPRLWEIPQEIDTTRHAYYFKQAKNAVPVRMSILDYILKY